MVVFLQYFEKLKYYLTLDVDECKGQSCDENANCENIPGFCRCTFREGFHGDEIICKTKLKVILSLIPLNS